MPQRSIVLLNAAAAIAASTADKSIVDCLPLAQEALDSGQGLAKLMAKVAAKLDELPREPLNPPSDFAAAPTEPAPA